MLPLCEALLIMKVIGKTVALSVNGLSRLLRLAHLSVDRLVIVHNDDISQVVGACSDAVEIE